jgi:hypothetical protein
LVVTVAETFTLGAALTRHGYVELVVEVEPAQWAVLRLPGIQILPE